MLDPVRQGSSVWARDEGGNERRPGERGLELALKSIFTFNLYKWIADMGRDQTFCAVCEISVASRVYGSASKLLWAKN